MEGRVGAAVQALVGGAYGVSSVEREGGVVADCRCPRLMVAEISSNVVPDASW